MLAEQLAVRLVVGEPFPQRYHRICDVAQGGIRHLRVKVNALARAKSEILLALLVEDLYRPPYLVEFESLDERQLGVRGYHDVPLVPAPGAYREYPDRHGTEEAAERDVPTLVLVAASRPLPMEYYQLGGVMESAVNSLEVSPHPRFSPFSR